MKTMTPPDRTRCPAHRRPRGLGFVLTALLVVTGAGLADRVAAQQKLTPGATPKRSQAGPGTTVIQQGRPAFDYRGIGGSVYATGLGEVTVTVHPYREFLADGRKPYLTTVFFRKGESELRLGSNTEKRTVRLGRLERGEIRLVARSDGGDPVFESGPGSRNADGAPHSRVRQIKPGVVEVYFENTIEEGTRGDISEQHWYKDFKMTLTGAVTADQGMIFLLDRVNDPDPTTRDSARQALRLASPEMARQMGIH